MESILKQNFYFVVNTQQIIGNIAMGHPVHGDPFGVSLVVADIKKKVA